MFKSVLAAAMIAGATLPAMAEEPNIEPGMWEYNSTMSFEGDMPIPDQSETTSECVTIEDVREGDAFIEDMEGCEMTHRDMRRDGMDYAMECEAPDGTAVNMEASMQFNGDTATGTITGDMETPMGPMQMTIDLEGRRIGEC